MATPATVAPLWRMGVYVDFTWAATGVAMRPRTATASMPGCFIGDAPKSKERLVCAVGLTLSIRAMPWPRNAGVFLLNARHRVGIPELRVGCDPFPCSHAPIRTDRKDGRLGSRRRGQSVRACARRCGPQDKPAAVRGFEDRPSSLGLLLRRRDDKEASAGELPRAAAEIRTIVYEELHRRTDQAHFALGDARERRQQVPIVGIIVIQALPVRFRGESVQPPYLGWSGERLD